MEYGNLVVRCPFCGSIMDHVENKPVPFTGGMRVIYSCSSLDCQFHVLLDRDHNFESCYFQSTPGFTLNSSLINLR